MRGLWLGEVQVLAKIIQLLKVEPEPTLLWGGPFSSERKGPCPSAVYGCDCHQRHEGENATHVLHVTLCCSSHSAVSCFHVNKSLLVQREPGLLSVNEVIFFFLLRPFPT